MLKNRCESVDIDGMRELFDEIKEWCDYRNEVVHALMNKNVNSLDSELSDKAVQGMDIANRLDVYVRTIKKGNTIRKAANMHIKE